MHVYYLVELGAYMHQLQWTQVTRSDSAEMILHHLVTILVMFLSYITNLMRIGSTILFLHDLADIWLESGKCLNYMSKVRGRKWIKHVTDVFFAIFTATFAYTRLWLFPQQGVYSSVVHSAALYGWAMYLMIGLLVMLQCLHVFWFFLILKMVVKLFHNGGSVSKDERSDDDGFEDGGGGGGSLSDDNKQAAAGSTTQKNGSTLEFKSVKTKANKSKLT